MDINKVILLGRAGKDPEFFKTTKGEECASIRVATNSHSWDNSTKSYISHTTWHDVKVFSEYIAKYVREKVHKGSILYIEGYIKQSEFTGRDGIKKQNTNIIVTHGGVLKAEQREKNPNLIEEDHHVGEYDENSAYQYHSVDDEIPF